MGSAFVAHGAKQGVIPSAMHTIFNRVKADCNTDFTIRVGFVEILTVSQEGNHVSSVIKLAIPRDAVS